MFLLVKRGILCMHRSIVFTFDLGDGAAVIESTTKVTPGQWFSIEAERTATEGSLVINGGIANKGT